MPYVGLQCAIVVFPDHTTLLFHVKNSENDQEIPQSQMQTSRWHQEEEPNNNHETPGRQTKQSNQLSLPHQDDCKTRMDINNVQQNKEQLQTPTME